MSDEVLPIKPDVEFYTNTDLSIFEVYVNGEHVGCAPTISQAWLIAGTAFKRAFFKTEDAS